MDTMGDEATYTRTLEDQTISVSLGDKDSNTYFQATLNEDNSQYIGTWHYPEDDPPDATETIAYTRVDGNGCKRLPYRASCALAPTSIRRGLSGWLLTRELLSGSSRRKSDRPASLW